MLQSDISVDFAQFNADTLHSVQARLAEALKLLKQADLKDGRQLVIARLIQGADAAIAECMNA